ncbi:FkbM family methyltransferase [Labrys sp. ZIDIC5]|uniref:FkbM family methyltransferase n=1 Tax=Labrys sedimenti TaxID=3106036 RepID=UPI002ACA2E95|nr:FkbM family methyltransferase [Labrys sp. ZIDIC5]MDZ5451390.1 FkbM family methyltransferase [Labrys sp. ZIDIC5]
MNTRLRNVAGASFAVADDKDGFWDKAESGAWEPETLASVHALAGPGTLFIDIGGWIGPITLTAAALGADVLAFEPDPRAFELISANIAANPVLTSRIRLHHAAVSPTPGRVRLGSPKKPGDSMGSILAADSGAALWDAHAILPTDIAAMAGDAERLVLKMDVEGAEYQLLPHLASLLGPRTVAALIAFHPRLLAKSGRTADEIEALTATAQSALAAYRLQSLDCEGAPISRQVNSTVLATRK